MTDGDNKDWRDVFRGRDGRLAALEQAYLDVAAGASPCALVALGDRGMGSRCCGRNWVTAASRAAVEPPWDGGSTALDAYSCLQYIHGCLQYFPPVQRNPLRRPMTNASANLMLRLNPESKASISRAAALRGMSQSEYVRTIVVAQAQRELAAAEQQVLALSPAEQEAFWQALHEPATPTPAQQALGKLMRGE